MPAGHPAYFVLGLLGELDLRAIKPAMRELDLSASELAVQELDLSASEPAVQELDLSASEPPLDTWCRLAGLNVPPRRY